MGASHAWRAAFSVIWGRGSYNRRPAAAGIRMAAMALPRIYGEQTGPNDADASLEAWARNFTKGKAPDPPTHAALSRHP
jgi:hypothetical protein